MHESIGLNLVRVIPVMSDDLGEGFRIVSVELYDRGLVVRWLSPSERDIDAPPFLSGSLVQPVDVSDDQGTTYRPISGGAFGHVGSLRGESLIVPAPPPEAAVLTVSHENATVTVHI
jgi:hypothetical protein